MHLNGNVNTYPDADLSHNNHKSITMKINPIKRTIIIPTLLLLQCYYCHALNLSNNNSNRRSFLQKFGSASTGIITAVTVTVTTPPSVYAADDDVTTIEAPIVVPMKTFVDPKGLFVVNVPKRFFTLRRTEKGDLPDEKTGKGRRGSSIFTAGDMTKAEIVAVERFPTEVLLLDQGLEVKPNEDLSAFTKIGSAQGVAELLYLKREREMQGKSRSKLILESVQLSEDGKSIEFQLTTNIDVQKPELLMEQQGISELNRITLARATLNSKDGQIMAVYASALEQDFEGPDGKALKDTVSSFTVTDNSSKFS